MSNKLRHYLFEHYAINGFQTGRNLKKDYHIQVDDQDDSDLLSEFCNIFVTVGKNNCMEVEICGGIPVTQNLADFAEIYDGLAEPSKNRMVLYISPLQIEALLDLAFRMKKTAELGYAVQNPNWEKICARTVSSIYRFVRVVKEYRKLKKYNFI